MSDNQHGLDTSNFLVEVCGGKLGKTCMGIDLQENNFAIEILSSLSEGWLLL